MNYSLATPAPANTLLVLDSCFGGIVLLSQAMELRHMRYFVAVAEEKNFTRAAARLHLAQPSLSRQIRDLENELGVPLLHRGKGGLTLTAAGNQYLAQARRILADSDAAVRIAQAAGRAEHRQLLIGA